MGKKPDPDRRSTTAVSQYVEVTTQAELDKALKRSNVIPVCRGNGYFSVGDSATVEAGDSATVRAGDSATVEAWDSATVRAGKYVAVTKQRGNPAISGGVVIEVPKITTAEEWCDFYGVEVKDGVATLYKALDGEFESGYGFSYTPGTIPDAPDWDGGARECGGGLHFSPRPFLALQFASRAERFVACPVRLSDIAVHPDPMYPNKVKAKGCCGPVWECDIDGNPVGAREAA